MARLIAAALEGVFVHPRDSGGTGGGHDLDIERDGRICAAVEIATAADADCLALWNLVNDPGEHWVESALTAGWSVALLPHARNGLVRPWLPRLLGRLERAGEWQLVVRDGQTDPETSEARRLGVASAVRDPAALAGSIALTIQQPPQHGGRSPANTGDALSTWLESWLRDPDQARSISTLAAAQVSERHLFVVLSGFTDAPDGVVDLLMRDRPPLPLSSPDLPAPVTHVWAASTWAVGMGMRWAPEDGWNLFRKI